MRHSRFIVAFLAALGAIYCAAAGELEGLSPEQKLARLGKFGRELRDSSYLVRVLTEGLSDPVEDVRTRSAEIAGVWISNLNPSAAEGSPTEDEIRNFKAALEGALRNTPISGRISASIGLAFLNAPNAASEAILFKAITEEKDPQVKIEMVGAMAMAGYRSPALVEEALATFQADDRQRQWHHAILALGHLRAPSALAALESAARTVGERQQHAIKGIIAYGSESGHAMEILKKLANDPALQQNHRNHAEVGIKRLSETAPPSKAPYYAADIWSRGGGNDRTIAIAKHGVVSTDPAPIIGRVAQSAGQVEASDLDDKKTANTYFLWCAAVAGVLAVTVLLSISRLRRRTT